MLYKKNNLYKKLLLVFFVLLIFLIKRSYGTVLPKPNYDNMFFLTPCSDNFMHPEGVTGDVNKAIFFRDNFGSGSCGPYARSGVCVWPSYLTGKDDWEQRDLDYKLDLKYLEETLSTVETASCPISIGWNSGHWGLTWPVVGSIGHWLMEEPEKWGISQNTA